MNLSSRSRGMVVLVAGIALTASAQLNPTVAVLPKASTIVPIECEQGLAPQKMARLDVSQIPEPQISGIGNAPPSVTLRDTLRDAQTAGEQNDRNDFVDALARARALVESYPAGAERNTAADVVHVLNDVDRVWSYQFESPTGAFIESSNPLLVTLRSYSGYEAAVADDVITNGGVKLYPSHESRMFLLRESGRRLSRLGVRGNVQVTERAPNVVDEDRPAHALPRVLARKPGEQPEHTNHTTRGTKSTSKTAGPAEKQSTPVKHHHREKKASVTPPKHTKRHEAVKVAEASAPKHESSATSHHETVVPKHEAVVPKHDAAAPRHEATSAPAHEAAAPKHEARSTKHESAPKHDVAAVPPPSGSMTSTQAPASTSPAPMSSSAAPSTATTAPSTATSAPPTTTTASTTTAPDTTTSTTVAPTMSDTTATTSTSPASTPAPQTNRTRNVVLPIILILLGVGVLVVLFRASS